VSFPRFLKYKDSGISWLGELPDEWEVIKLSRRLDKMPCYGVLVPNYVDEGVPMLRINDIEDGIASREHLKNITPELSEEFSRTVLEEGDIALAVVGTIGRSLIVGKELVGCNLSRAVARVIPGKGLSSQMLRWIFESLCFRHYTDLTCVGTAQRVLNMNSLSSFSIAVPNIETQVCIDKFLSREIAKIDALIAEQLRLIELLQEKRQAVISHAVTKGLNPNAPMKDSGVEWLGEVPEPWRVMPLRWAAKCCSGDGLSSTEISSIGDDEYTVPVIGGNGLMGYTNQAKTNYSLLAIGRVGALCGNVHIVHPPAWITDNALVLDPDSSIFDLGFLSLTLRSRNLNDIASKTAQPLITGTQVGDQRIPCPPLSEQHLIASHLMQQSEQFDTLSTEAQRAIVLLQERRSALISAAVTGQIDVRGLALEGAA
jgi:type I restriction enzyme S subunit